MDFFAAQDRARRASRWLVLWFLLAVLGSVGIVYLAVAMPLAGEGGALWQPGLFILVALGIGGTILGGSAWKVAELAAGGGATVAASLGGRLVPRATTDPAERRLVNLADEMAVAAGIPAPPVYVLDHEPGINAFAAGARPREAVVAVTRGTLEKLTREELQGVMAHEFSHILNGDMRLNLRLIGVLHGLFMLATAGRILLRSGGGGSNKNRGGLVALGLALVIAGYVGVLAGRLIRAAVSRQREFLADASAVQFTRNPSGIASALRKIAKDSAPLSSPQAEAVSHMLFDAGKRFAGWLATHPSLAERIRRIEGGRPAVAPPQVAVPPTFPESPVAGFTPAPAPPATQPAHVSAPTPQAFAATVGAPTAATLAAAQQVIETLPEVLRTAVATPAGARAAVLALLLARNPQQRAAQLELLARRHDAAFAREVAAVPADLAAGLRLPLIELALGSLRELPRSARQVLLATGEALANADGRVTITEYLLLRLLRDALVPAVPPPLLTIPGALARHGALLLSLMAHAGSRDPAAVAAAFARGAAHAPVDGLNLLPLSEMRTEALDRTLETLALAVPLYRQRFVAALAAVAWGDGKVAPVEAELLAAVCGALDCPVPASPPPAVPAKGGAGGRASAVTGTTLAAGTAAAQLAASPASPETELAHTDRLPIQALFIANLIPAFGVVFFGWDVMTVLILYWLENLVVGFYTLVRMIRAGGWTALMPGAFFTFHYGVFCAAHGVMLVSFFSDFALEGGGKDPLEPYRPEHMLGGFLELFEEMWMVLQYLWHEHCGLFLPFLGFVVSHGISAVVHYVIADEDAEREAGEIMFDPYKRVFVMHLTLIAGGFAMVLTGGASLMPLVLLLVGIKTAQDVHLHRKAHAARIEAIQQRRLAYPKDKDKQAAG